MLMIVRYTNHVKKSFDYLSDMIKKTYNNNKTQTLIVVYIYLYNTITHKYQGN